MATRFKRAKRLEQSIPRKCMSPVSVVVMAKAAIPGQVKTRLIGEYTAEQAAGVHLAMLNCVLERVEAICGGCRLVLALDDVKFATDDQTGLRDVSEWVVVEQGQGDLGQRMQRVWQGAGGAAAVFLGADSPDFPVEQLVEAVGGVLGGYDVVVGPVDDGGYWTVGGRMIYPQIFTGIDWGSERVYHQTLAAAGELEVLGVGQWFDVDTPADLQALRERLNETDEQALKRLAAALDEISKETKR